ncbi:DUF223 domain protein, partial [Trifolium medium]|nr:DUF223 domain protein [Trifolium medium]
MARSIDSIKDITDLKELWKLAVRIEDLWSVFSKSKEEHLEFILLDKQGDQIQAVVPNDLLEHWKSNLKEG